MASLTARPQISGNVRTSPQYRTMGFGNTSRIVLIGHADGLAINDPYQVNDMQEAINTLQADATSPLLRGLLEVYNAGARDIWLVAAAPMSEYISNVNERLDLTQDAYIIDGGYADSMYLLDIQFYIDSGYPYTFLENGFTFYQKYYQRLISTYLVLRDLDFAEIIVPLEASFVHTDGVDFASQLIDFCQDYNERTGMVGLGVLGTRRPSDISIAESVQEMVTNSNLLSSSSFSKFVIVAAGEGAISVPQLSFTHKASIAAHVAANMATTSLDRGMAYSKLTNIVNLDGYDYTKAQLDSLAQAKINPAVRTYKAKRGAPFQTVLLTDNTLAADGSDFWSLSNVRVTAKCSNIIRSMGNAWIGSTDIAGFKQAVFDFLAYMVRSNVIKTFTLNIDRDTTEATKIIVDVSLTPFSSVRQIYFTVEVGPGV